MVMKRGEYSKSGRNSLSTSIATQHVQELINYTPHFLFKQALNSPYVTESCVTDKKLLLPKHRMSVFPDRSFQITDLGKNISRNYKILKNKIMLKPRKGQENRMVKYMNKSSEKC